MTDAELREIYQRGLTTRTAACPSPDAIEALVAKHGAEESRLATLDHIMSCATCRQDFELLRAISAAEAANARPRWRAPWLVAAAIVVLASAVTLTRLGRSNPTRGAAPSDIPLVGVVNHALVWRAIPGALRYDVETVDAAGATVFHATTTDTSVALPPTPAGVNWWVRATLRDGSERRSAVVALP